MRRPERRDSIEIGPLRTESTGGTCRVTAAVDGEDVWFESDSGPLATVAEAWATAFMIPALEHHARLRIADPVDAVWLEQSAAAQRVLHEWWRYPLLPPVATSRPSRAPDHGDRRTALFFSGGADSFYTLLHGGHPVHALVVIQGFDFGLDAASRHRAVERSVRAVAAARGIDVAVVRSNVRAHHLIAPLSWERVHGGILAGVGHVLGEGIVQVLMSSSISLRSGRPWGSHYRLDPLWGSARRTFVPVGQERRKGEKLRAIAEDPLTLEHLRVCWQNAAGDGNCSRCNKCVYARLVFADCGVLERSRTFEGPEHLAEHVDALPRAKQRPGGYSELLHGSRDGEPPASPPHGSNLTPDMRRAIAGLLERTAHLESWPVRLRRALLTGATRWTGSPRR